MKQETIKYLENELESLISKKDFLRIDELVEKGIIPKFYYNQLLNDIKALTQVLELLKEKR